MILRRTLFLAGWIACGQLIAHDFYILPERFVAAPSGQLLIAFNNGDRPHPVQRRTRSQSPIGNSLDRRPQIRNHRRRTDECRRARVHEGRPSRQMAAPRDQDGTLRRASSGRLGELLGKLDFRNQMKPQAAHPQPSRRQSRPSADSNLFRQILTY